jgi:predicted HTH transcriptional regulator
MKEQAVKNAHNEEQKAHIKDVGRQQLRSWGILIERDGKDYPSNAYAILTDSGGLHIATQCGVFKGITKEVFVDRWEYTGSLWEQIEEVFQFVLRNIHLGATIVGIYRQDVYEIPRDAIRELIINAMVHRSYLDYGTIQVAVYDNRLEITSPGKLPMGQTLERMKEGYSKIRNEALAHEFSYMNLIEHWGSGIPRIIGKVKATGLQEPEFIGDEVDLRINIYRGQMDTSNNNNTINNANNAINNAKQVKHGVNNMKSTMSGIKIISSKERKRLEKLLQVIAENPSETQAYYAEQIGVSKRTISRIFASLQKEGILVQNGTKRKSDWIIIKREHF